MEFSVIKQLYYERTLTKCEKKKREDVAQAIERDNPGMGDTPEGMAKKMRIATAQAKKSCDESSQFHHPHQSHNISIDQSHLPQKSQTTDVSNYDKVVTYYRSLGLDPYKLKGKVGKALRDKIKKSPSFHAWLKANRYESVDTSSENPLVEIIKDVKKSKKPDVTFYGYPGKEEKKQIDSIPDSMYKN